MGALRALPSHTCSPRIAHTYERLYHQPPALYLYCWVGLRFFVAFSTFCCLFFISSFFSTFSSDRFLSFFLLLHCWPIQTDLVSQFVTHKWIKVLQCINVGAILPKRGEEADGGDDQVILVENGNICWQTTIPEVQHGDVDVRGTLERISWKFNQPQYFHHVFGT